MRCGVGTDAEAPETRKKTGVMLITNERKEGRRSCKRVVMNNVGIKKIHPARGRTTIRNEVRGRVIGGNVDVAV